jgi:hypothetical protein
MTTRATPRLSSRLAKPASKLFMTGTVSSANSPTMFDGGGGDMGAHRPRLAGAIA